MLGLCLRSVRRRIRFKNKTSWLCSSEAMASRADTALTVSLQEEHLPNSHVHLAVGTPLWCCCIAVVVLLLPLPSLALVTCHPRALSCLVTPPRKFQRKNENGKKKKKEKGAKQIFVDTKKKTSCWLYSTTHCTAHSALTEWSNG